jgi:hypothetical protein
VDAIHPYSVFCVALHGMQAVHFEECREVSVQGVTLQNAQQFQLTFTRCSCVKASFLRVVAPADSPNTDGIHLNDTSHVRITDNLISTGPRLRLARLNYIYSQALISKTVKAAAAARRRLVDRTD